MVRLGREVGEGEAQNSGAKRPFVRSGTSRGAHVRALWLLLLEMEDMLPDAPSARRARLRVTRRLLERAYPELQVSDIDVAQYLAEEDGEEVQDEDATRPSRKA